MSQEEIDKEIVEMKEQLSVLWMLLEEHDKYQWYGWTLKKKKVRWHLLQVKLRQSMYAKLKRELRAAECEEKIYYCEPEQGVFFDKEEDMDDEERIVESFLSIWTSSYQHEGVVTKESNGDPYVFKFDVLCMTACDEQPWEDVFMHVNEEMKLREEMSEMEEFLVEHVFVGLENGHPLEAAIEDEDNAEFIQEYEAVRNAEVLQEYEL